MASGEELIDAIARRELGATPDSVVEVTEGNLHETYELHCDDRGYVLQFGSDVDEQRRDALGRSLGCYLALRDTEVPVPEVVTEAVRSFDGRRYALVELRPGETAKLDVSPAKTRRAGRCLAQVHDARTFDAAGWIRYGSDELRVQPFEGGLSGWISHTLEETVRTLREGGMETAGTAVERSFDGIRTDFSSWFDGDRSGAPIDERPVLCHGDFSPDNVLFRDGNVTAILDFDRAYAGHEQRDLAKAANAFWMHDPGADWAIRETFYEGYREERRIDPTFERREPLYRVETLANAVAGLLSMGELTEYERSFYTERIEDAIARLDGV